ncbi:ECF-family sigma factor E [Corynebacterium diphtheriae CDCE 8392]|nr:ECF-family sigma factor E [Corynebacterium diphtheriae CDCE 8392]CAB0640934.1 RNA polymerase sigma factor SigE [Corynebacterium diphtheriae]CAB0641666.1 RNA polymerase sigma factor SigE [Corynebacterium diphtheriae]CAB0793324.1 RNA polymerase sigma factor SigE [Corynebacterium diphtheriae]CAB0837794.1 RNA polymerase sigma factor SigE [Corynebacterium diphtheriae]
MRCQPFCRNLAGFPQNSPAQSTTMTYTHGSAFPSTDDVTIDADVATEELTGTAAFDAGVGDMPSWEELVAQHADSVYRLAFRLSGNQHDAEDLTQETFMRVFRSLKGYQPGTFEGWLHRITTNLFLDMVRHRAKIRMEALPEDYERVPGTDMTPEQAYNVSNLDPALQKALDDLSPDFRVAVVLCDVVGMSYDEIADTLGVKMGTVRSRIHRGRSQLRAHLENQATSDEGAQLLLATGR